MHNCVVEYILVYMIFVIAGLLMTSWPWLVPAQN